LKDETATRQIFPWLKLLPLLYKVLPTEMDSQRSIAEDFA